MYVSCQVRLILATGNMLSSATCCMRVGGTGHPRMATHLGVGRSLNKTYEGRPENTLFQETLLHFFQGQLIRTPFFFFSLLKISLIKDYFS